MGFFVTTFRADIDERSDRTMPIDKETNEAASALHVPVAGSRNNRIPLWPKIKPFVTRLEMIGLAVAVLVASWHTYEIRRTAADLKQAMSTRSIGSFPDFVDDVEKTVSGAKREVIVACDFAAYADFDGRGLPIRQAIERKIGGGLPVHLTFLSAARGRSARLAQFPEAQWNDTMKNPEGRRAIVNYLASHGGDSKLPTYANFIATLERTEENVARQVFRGADISRIDQDMALFFWIVDGERAVMVVQSYGGREDSAFWTSDLRLITALKSIAQRYRQSPAAGNLR